MLFDSVEISPIGVLKNRTVMSAMTRNFCPDHVATDASVAYYSARAKGGAAIILTEGIVVHPSADGYRDVPHIHTSAHAASWKPVIDAVHAEGSKIYCQLWHCGRISHSDFTGEAPVSSTNVAATGMNRQNGKPFGTPRALDASEMSEQYKLIVDAGQLALDAGFDGVQIHMGHGYLVDQFFDARVNDRTDQYGGSVENRCRFAVELLEAALASLPADRVMVRISPSRFMGELYDWPDMDEMLKHLLPIFSDLGLQTLDVSCANANYYDTSGRVLRQIKKLWPGTLIGGASLTQEQAEIELNEGHVDLVTWGRSFLANPNFVTLMQNGADIAPFSPEMLGSLK
jgi:N-ethylmaleimide reductase